MTSTNPTSNQRLVPHTLTELVNDLRDAAETLRGWGAPEDFNIATTIDRAIAALGESAGLSDETGDDLAKVYDAFQIGSAVRTPATLLANVENSKRRSDCLSAIEREFFTYVVADEDGEDMERCDLSWGADPSEYVAQFRVALSKLNSPVETSTDGLPASWKADIERSQEASVERCGNWPCQLARGHEGPCSSAEPENRCLHTWQSFDDGEPVRCQRTLGHVGPHASSPDSQVKASEKP